MNQEEQQAPLSALTILNLHLVDKSRLTILKSIALVAMEKFKEQQVSIALAEKEKDCKILSEHAANLTFTLTQMKAQIDAYSELVASKDAEIERLKDEPIMFIEWATKNEWKFNAAQNMWRNENGIVIMDWPTPPLYISTKRLYEQFNKELAGKTGE
jgi:hypothetical protein